MIRPRLLAIGALLCVGAWPSPAAAQTPTEIEVRGSPIPVPPKEPEVAGSVIRRERLQAPGLQVSDALRAEPGVSVNETGGYSAPSTASLRGASAAQTPIYLAGVRLNDEVGGAADLAAVPPWFLNRIEIYRSHAPLAGDTLGLGGAIFLEPRRPSGPEASAGGMLGSYGAHSLYGSAGVGDAQRGVLLGIRFDGASNDYSYENDNGTRFDPSQAHRSILHDADVKRLEIWAIGSARWGASGRADLVLNDSEREQGVPSLALFSSIASRARLTRRLAAVSTRAVCGGSCRITSSSSAWWSDARYSDPLNELGLGADSLEISGARVEHALSVETALSPRVSLSPAFHTSVERLWLQSSGSPELHAARAFGRAALQAEWRATHRLTLRALGSAECHDTSRSGTVPWAAPGDVDAARGHGACDDFEPAGRVGGTLDVGGLTLLATLGRYARVPTLSELYGTSGFVRGNSALLPERGVSVELGLRSGPSLAAALGGVVWDAFAFARQANDLISYQRSAIGYVRPYNVGSARVVGVEAKAGYEPLSWLVAELSLTLTDPRDTSASHPVNNVLPHQAQVVIAPRLELHRASSAGNLNDAKLVLLYLYQGTRYADRANLIAIGAQGSLDLEASVTALDSHWVVSLRLANLLDQTRFDLIGYPLPGRAAYLSTELRL